MLAFRSTGWGGVDEVSERYFVRYRSTRFEVSREEYEETRRRGRITDLAAVALMASMFGLIGIEQLRRVWVPRRRKRESGEGSG